MTERIRRLLRRRVEIMNVALYDESKLESADRSAISLAERLLNDEGAPHERLVKATVFLDKLYKQHWPDGVDIDSLDWESVEANTN